MAPLDLIGRVTNPCPSGEYPTTAIPSSSEAEITTGR